MFGYAVVLNAEALEELVWNKGPGAHVLLITLFFFYKNIFYKNIEAEICEILRIF